MPALSVLVAVAIVFGALVSMAARITDRDVAWISGTTGASPSEAEVYRRYLQRLRRHRLAGGLLGSLFALVVGIRFYASVSIGVGQQSPLADVLFCGLAGVLVGAFSAESFRLSEPPSSTVSASLAARPGASRPDLTRLARGIVAAALIAGALVAVTGHGFTPWWIAVAGAALTLLAEATQAAIKGRRRPVLSDRAHAVDLTMRSFASTSTAYLQLAAAVLTAAWTVSKIDLPFAPVAVVQGVVVLASLVLTVVLLHRASPRPPRTWLAAAS
jgi:hypothetical protein